MKRALFLCGRNKLRSPTAEQVFSGEPGVEVAGDGGDHDEVEVEPVDHRDRLGRGGRTGDHHDAGLDEARQQAVLDQGAQAEDDARRGHGPTGDPTATADTWSWSATDCSTWATASRGTRSSTLVVSPVATRPPSGTMRTTVAPLTSTCGGP